MSPEQVATHFDVPGRVVAVQGISSGNVNDTYRAICRTAFSEEQFVLQKLNTNVFPDPYAVMANIRKVTTHAHAKIEKQAAEADRSWQLPRVIPTREGSDVFEDDSGGSWRGLSLIASATSHETVQGPEHARQAGTVLGHFQNTISDLAPDGLADTLPGFHIMPDYLKKYEEALASEGGQERLAGTSEAGRIAEFIASRRAGATILQDALATGELELRPVHGDPKISNILIDDISGKGTSIIDLDTVKPGLVHYDFGDCARSCCNPAGEESTKHGDVLFDTDLFAALAKGYLRQAGGFLTSADRFYLFDSVRILTLELVVRFFADYLAGDVYFKTNYDTQNLNRAAVQMKLCESIEDREADIRRILQSC